MMNDVYERKNLSVFVLMVTTVNHVNSTFPTVSTVFVRASGS